MPCHAMPNRPSYDDNNNNNNPPNQPTPILSLSATIFSRDINPTETNHLPPTTHTLVKVVHGQRHPTVVAQAQTPARPDNDGPRCALAHHALRALGPQPGRARRPGRVCGGGVSFSWWCWWWL